MTRTLHYSDIVAALSHALDLRGGQPLGHSVRTCLIGMEMGRFLRLPPADLASLYYALLLKDGGGPGAGEPGSPGPDRASAIATALGFERATSVAIRHLGERWDGSGGPDGLAGASIPLLARICAVAQAADLALVDGGIPQVERMLDVRRGRWFDPELVDLVTGWGDRTDWWAQIRTARSPRALCGVEPDDRRRTLSEPELDRVAEAFAEVIDAKSSFTYDHSRRVAEYARALGVQRGASPEEARRLYRGGLLHDIGKMAIPERLLVKPTPLGPSEVALVRAHPIHSFEILRHVPAFQDVAHMAAYHHERLDGSGYPWGLSGEELDEGCRIMAVADMYEALTADRPYRPAVEHDKVLQILHLDARRNRVDGGVVDALEACVDSQGRLVSPPTSQVIPLHRPESAPEPSPILTTLQPVPEGRVGERWGWVLVG